MTQACQLCEGKDSACPRCDGTGEEPTDPVRRAQTNWLCWDDEELEHELASWPEEAKP